MRLLTGPAGSGKTFQVLAGFREALRQRDDSARLLVPTATMLQHLQNRLAREGYVFRPGLIQTLSRFVEPWADTPQVSGPLFYLLVEEAARRVNRPEFTRVLRLPGFCASLARTCEEFSSSGCDARRLAAHLPGARDAPLADAFLAVYREVDRALEVRGLALRSKRLRQAAGRIAAEGLGGIRTIWLDGFLALPDPELSVIDALARHAELTITMPNAPVTEATRMRLLALGAIEQGLNHAPRSPRVEICTAPSIERECDQIARRILEQAALGRPFREMGIVVRSPEIYQAILRATLERFGIPARFYFDSPLSEHAVARYLSGAVDALLGGWDHAETLAVLRLAPQLADSAELDLFDFEVRWRLPGKGLAALTGLAPAGGSVAELLAELGALDVWRGLRLSRADWAAHARNLRALWRPQRPTEPATHALAALWREQASALERFAAVLDEAAALDPGETIALAGFWHTVKSILRLTPLRVPDQRRNVVHVLSAHEARQWELEAVFLCGMVEKQFPHFHAPDPFFPESARARLRQAGIHVRTAAEFDREERFLFDSACGHAGAELLLTYSQFDARGEENTPSLFLQGLKAALGAARPILPQTEPASPTERPPRPLRDPEILRILAERHKAPSVTALESYLQCPFQFFGRTTLALEEPPARPDQRLDARFEGNIVHKVLAEIYRLRQPLEPVFARVFEETCARERIPRGYRSEAARRRLLGDLQAFLHSDAWPTGLTSRTEQDFAVSLDEDATIRGRIDRLDVTADGRGLVIDYKYSSSQITKARLQNENLLQPPLYLLAVDRVFELEPAGVFYCGLRGSVTYAGWGAGPGGLPFPPGWIEKARASALRAIAEIRAGRIAPDPADPGLCRYCAYRDVCRYQASTVAATAEGA